MSFFTAQHLCFIIFIFTLFKAAVCAHCVSHLLLLFLFSHQKNNWNLFGFTSFIKKFQQQQQQKSMKCLNKVNRILFSQYENHREIIHHLFICPQQHWCCQGKNQCDPAYLNCVHWSIGANCAQYITL